MFQQEILKLTLKLIENQNVNELRTMNKSLYELRCRCKEEVSVIKKKKSNNRSEGRPLAYPNRTETKSKTFHIKYKKPLSSIAKMILNSFQNKYFYYAIDDILYFLKLRPRERDALLAILYSPILSLQNNFSIDFFDIWIQEIYISRTSRVNKFLTKNDSNFDHFSYITIKFFYTTKLPTQKPESLW